MFENILKYYKRSSNIQLRNFERAFNMNTGGVHMSCDKYKKKIIELINKIEDEETLLFILEIIERIKD